MSRDVSDFADTVRGQLSHIEYLLNIYSDNIYSPDSLALVDMLKNVHSRLTVAQNNVTSMIESYGPHIQGAVTSKHNTTNKLRKRE